VAGSGENLQGCKCNISKTGQDIERDLLSTAYIKYKLLIAGKIDDLE